VKCTPACCRSLCDQPATHGFGLFVWSRCGVKQFSGELGRIWFCDRHLAEVTAEPKLQVGILDESDYRATIEADFASDGKTIDWTSLKVYAPPLALAQAISPAQGTA
jgi:hypothetical protein